MKVVLCKVGEEAQIADITNDLETLQDIVGGYIEIIHPFEDRECCMVLNDIGKLIPLIPNRSVQYPSGSKDIIHGDFVICYAPPYEEDFTDMPDDLAEKYRKMFEHPWL